MRTNAWPTEGWTVPPLGRESDLDPVSVDPHQSFEHWCSSVLPQRHRRDLGVDLVLNVANFVRYGHHLFSSARSSFSVGFGLSTISPVLVLNPCAALRWRLLRGVRGGRGRTPLRMRRRTRRSRGRGKVAYPIIATIRAIARFRGWLTDYGGWVCLHIVAPYVFVLAPLWREVVPLSRRGCVRALRGSRSRRTGSMTAAAALRRTLR